jgi:hypothetical protein
MTTGSGNQEYRPETSAATQSPSHVRPANGRARAHKTGRPKPGTLLARQTLYLPLLSQQSCLQFPNSQAQPHIQSP